MEQSRTRNFIDNASEALDNSNLQEALDKMKGGFVVRRSEARFRLPEFDDICNQAREIKDHTLAHLDFYLERFERKVKEQGGHVHWCATPEDARQAILAICRDLAAKPVTKGKSMIGEGAG